MRQFHHLTIRNSKLFFKDRGMFFTALITPIILLVLYATFLASVYKDIFTSNIPAALHVPESLIDGCVGGQLFSSLLAVCCITVAFCSNMLMVQDKVTGARKDLTITPVRHSVLALSYYFSTFLTTLMISFVTLGACFIYLANVGWYLSVSDVLFVLLDVVLLSLFGTALSSLINFFLKSQGQISAVGAIISAGYGFICGAYMPISSFSPGLQKVLSFLPGTYGTALIRNHAMQGTFAEMEKLHFPSAVLDGIKDAIDCNIYFFGEKVTTGTMYLVLAGSVLLLIGLYVLMNVLSRKRNG